MSLRCFHGNASCYSRICPSSPPSSSPRSPVLRFLSSPFSTLRERKEDGSSSRERPLGAADASQDRSTKNSEGTQPPIMPEVTHLVFVRRDTPTATPPATSAGAQTTIGLPTSSTPLPWEEAHLQVQTILIIVIFCVVCLLLLLAFFYAFCFHCSIKSWPTESHAAKGCSLDREDATFKCSSSDDQQVGNVV